jgi:hypothetical protein
MIGVFGEKTGKSPRTLLCRAHKSSPSVKWPPMKSVQNHKLYIAVGQAMCTVQAYKGYLHSLQPSHLCTLYPVHPSFCACLPFYSEGPALLLRHSRMRNFTINPIHKNQSTVLPDFEWKMESVIHQLFHACVPLLVAELLPVFLFWSIQIHTMKRHSEITMNHRQIVIRTI